MRNSMAKKLEPFVISDVITHNPEHPTPEYVFKFTIDTENARAKIAKNKESVEEYVNNLVEHVRTQLLMVLKPE